MVAGEEGFPDSGLGERRDAEQGDEGHVPEDRGYERRDGNAGCAPARQVDEQRREPEQSNSGAEQAAREVACPEAESERPQESDTASTSTNRLITATTRRCARLEVGPAVPVSIGQGQRTMGRVVRGLLLGDEQVRRHAGRDLVSPSREHLEPELPRRLVSVEQQPHKPPFAPAPVDAEVLCQDEPTTSRARLCIQPSRASWRMPASTSGYPVRPSHHASNQGLAWL